MTASFHVADRAVVPDRDIARPRPRLLVDGVEPRHYSASQISLYLGCKRKWHYEYPGGLKSEDTAATAYGKAVHTEIELALTRGIKPQDPRAMVGLLNIMNEVMRGVGPSVAEFSARMKHLHIEGDIVIDLGRSKRDGWPLVLIGFIDLLDTLDPLTPAVTDHKTTSDMRWAKTTYELEDDCQMNIYAHFALGLFPEAAAVKVQHNVILKKGRPIAALTATTIPRADVERRWSKYLAIVDEMERARTFPVERVPPTGLNNGECAKYRGCPHQLRCSFAPNPMLGKGDQHMDAQELMAKLQSARAIAAGEQPMPGQQPPSPAQTTPPLQLPPGAQQQGPPQQPPPNGGELQYPDAVQARLAAVRAELGAMGGDVPAQTAPPPAGGSFTPQPGAWQGTPAPTPQPFQAPGQGQGSMPPDMRLPPPPAQVPPPGTWNPIPGVPGPGAWQPGQAPPAGPPSSVPTGQAGGYGGPFAHGFPPGFNPANPSPMNPGPYGQPPQQQAWTPPQAPAPNPGAWADQQTAPARGRKPNGQAAQQQAPNVDPNYVPPANRIDFLLLNASVTYGLEGAVRLEQWIAPVLDSITRATGHAWQMHEFRRGPALVCAETWKTPAPSVLMVDTRTPLGSVVLEALIPRANVIINGGHV